MSEIKVPRFTGISLLPAEDLATVKAIIAKAARLEREKIAEVRASWEALRDANGLVEILRREWTHGPLKWAGYGAIVRTTKTQVIIQAEPHNTRPGGELRFRLRSGAQIKGDSHIRDRRIALVWAPEKTIEAAKAQCATWRYTNEWTHSVDNAPTEAPDE